jgi:hypothetical protein
VPPESLLVGLGNAFLTQVVGYFPGQKGWRQGDHMSPNLFVMTMEILSLLWEEDATNSLFGFHPKC